MGRIGVRSPALVAHQPDWVDWGDGGPSEMRFHQTEAAVYGAELVGLETGRRSKELKHRDEDDYRRVPLMADVEESLREHLDRGYLLSDRTWISPKGNAHLDWGNIRDTYIRPAFNRVFTGTPKAVLGDAPAGILRKTAITYWMHCGISEQQAAEWAGHTGDVQRIYYASRTSLDYNHEVALLNRNIRPRPQNL